MPFESAKQEMWMKINMHEKWKEWVRKYGHHPDFNKKYGAKKNSKPKTVKRKKTTKKSRRK